ncbi:MAG: RNA polymerase sigma factor [Christensenellaceae bacterium]|jgi:RNA polymerase sigma-70 factor (ECF subfamily)|nr:RNA polymerase sigma factor [Christensenellaceae bacterium]
MDDAQIVELFWQRSEDALSAAAARFGAHCRGIAKNILGSEADAEECLSDALLRAWNAIPPAKPLYLKAFFGKIARNLALDRYAAARAQKRGGGAVEIALEELGEVLAAPSGAEEGEIMAAIHAFLREEPPELRRLFVKRYFYLQGIGEIARERGCGEGRIRSALFRQRGRLKKRLESEGLI